MQVRKKGKNSIDFDETTDLVAIMYIHIPAAAPDLATACRAARRMRWRTTC